MPKPQARPAPSPPDPAAQRRRRLKKLRADLGAQRAALARWMTRLKRAFHSVEKLQARVARIEREINKLVEQA